MAMIVKRYSEGSHFDGDYQALIDPHPEDLTSAKIIKRWKSLSMTVTKGYVTSIVVV